MVRDGRPSRCKTCGSGFVDQIILYSQEQVDPLFRPSGRELIRVLAREMELPRHTLERLFLAARQKAWLESRESKPDYVSRPVRINYTDVCGFRMPLCLEVADDNELYWS